MPTITFNKKYLEELGEFLATLKNIKALDVLPYHDMGKVKYKNMGIKYQLENIEPLTKEQGVEARNYILESYRKSLKK